MYSLNNLFFFNYRLRSAGAKVFLATNSEFAYTAVSISIFFKTFMKKEISVKLCETEMFHAFNINI